MLCLTLEHEGRRRVVPVRSEPLVLGRGEDCDVTIAASTLSSEHARITLSPEGVLVEDLESRNGTFADDRRVSREILQAPVRLRFGKEVHALLAEMDSEDVALDPKVQVVPAEASETDARRSVRSTAAATEATSAFAATLLQALADGADGLGLLDAAVATGTATGGLVLELLPDGEEPVLVHSVGRPPELDDALRAELFGALQSERRHGRSTAGDGTAFVWVVDELGMRPRLTLCSSSGGRGLSSRVLETALRALSRLGASAQPVAPTKSKRRRFTLEGGERPAVVGTAAVIRALHDRMRGALSSDLPILLTGETGVGKELYARSLHQQSDRGQGPFVAVNASALPDSLLESLLFGAQAGAATGVKEQRGLMREADGGSLFLDEIGEMSMELQSKLLRALELREVLPLGATTPTAVDVRFVAATNRDLEADIEAGRFRRDLFYRLSGHVYRIPALRERREDVPAFVSLFLRDECERLGIAVGGVTVKAMRDLSAHAWPGNVRELEALMRRLAHELDTGEPLRSADLPESLATKETGTVGDSLDAHIDAFQRPIIEKALADCEGNRTAVAERLGISRPRLKRTMERLGLADDGDA